MSIILNANNPNEVSSPSSFEVLLGDPAQRIIILSGIAIPSVPVNDDEHVYRDEVIVNLGVTVANVRSAVASVGLASVTNAETAFLIGIDTARVEVHPSTSELQLKVTTALLGEKTFLHRFGYQVVAHVHKIAARISGSIRVPKDILDLSTLSAADIGALFHITANRVDFVPPTSSNFGYERLIPLATGSVGDTRSVRGDCFVEYAIDACPFGIPLRVQVDLLGRFQPLSALCGQVAGPRPVLLTNVAPEANGVDFAVTRVVVK